MSRINAIIESIRHYGFAITSDLALHELIHVLGSTRFFNIYKLGQYIIVEINKNDCEAECKNRCINGAASPMDLECIGSCIDLCIIEKLNIITKNVKAHNRT